MTTLETATIDALLAELDRRGVLGDIDLADVPPGRLAAAIMADPAARRAYGALLVGRRKEQNRHGQKPLAPEVIARIRELRAAGKTKTEVAKQLKISARSVARHQR